MPRLFGRPKYRQRNNIERMFGRLKENRRIVTCLDKLAKIYGAMVSLAVLCGVYDITFRTEPRHQSVNLYQPAKQGRLVSHHLMHSCIGL
ncbi:transposase [Pseudomonas sp. 21615526]|nr:transposase [Pseudomonas sp. 21615526]